MQQSLNKQRDKKELSDTKNIYMGAKNCLAVEFMNKKFWNTNNPLF